MEDRKVKFEDMVRAMQYLVDEVTNLRYKLLQYESGAIKPDYEKKKAKKDKVRNCI